MDARLDSCSLLLTGPRQLEWVSETLPALKPDEVLVQTTAGAISIGSELPLYLGTARSDKPAFYPRMTGYESVGRVLACGSAVQQIRVGGRVLAFYGHRTHAVIAERKAIALPDEIADALALLAILTCDVGKGIRKLVPQPDEPVLVTGAGAIGLLTVFMLKAMGVQAIDVIEPLAARRVLALSMGARQALDLDNGRVSTCTYSVAIECSSRNEAFQLLQAKMQQNGRLGILADGNLEPLVLAPEFHEKELLVVASSDGWDYRQHAVWYFQHLQEHSPGLEQLFQEQIASDALPGMFERLATGAIRPIKVLVRYHQNDQHAIPRQATGAG